MIATDRAPEGSGPDHLWQEHCAYILGVVTGKTVDGPYLHAELTADTGPALPTQSGDLTDGAE